MIVLLVRIGILVAHTLRFLQSNYSDMRGILLETSLHGNQYISKWRIPVTIFGITIFYQTIYIRESEMVSEKAISTKPPF